MTMTTKQRPGMPISRTDALTFQSDKAPAFIQAVNRAANLKVLAAIKTGKLRLVVPPKSQTSARYTPRVDIVDDPSSSSLVAMFELPGISGNDIQISISDGAFTVWGERRPPYLMSTESFPKDPISAADNVSAGSEMDIDHTTIRHTKVYVQELCFGTFSRTVNLPKGVKGSDLKANLRDGMLIVTYPRQAVVAESPKPPRNVHTPSPPMPMLAAGTASQ